ncbi:hypothetical protein IGI04_036053 [Brassica rapa subsp. trilocularis]|uniref:Uncharacterized protein n=1 Tax=Brassica rapa subsp. trilocularis TaxID=1813537 RepID=A0ABQ7LGH5_BRACM|nr:hypothetical protein IGI04_036053 [Brassica rapa subsp. trilocularis]
MTSVGVRQHTQDVHGFPWLSVSTHRTSLAVHVCPCVSVSTHMTKFCPTWAVFSVHTGRLWVSASTHRTSVAVSGCPSAHTGRPWLSVCVRQHTQDVRGCPLVHISRWSLDSACWSLDSACWPFPWTIWVILAHVGCLFSTHRTSVGVHQHTQYVRDCPSAHTGRPWLSMCDRVYPSAHTRRPWLSMSTHITTLVLGLSMLTLPVDCSGDFGPRGQSVQYTQDIPHTGRPWLSISTHISTLVLGLSTLALPVDCLGDFGPHGLSVQYTHDVRGCPPAHTGRPWLFVAVRQHKQDILGCPCNFAPRGLSFQYTQDLRGCPPAHIGRDFGPCGLSFQCTQVVCGCPPALQDVRGCQWLSVSTHRTSVAVHVCPSAHTGRLWLSISTHISALVLGLSTLALPMDCLGDFGPRGLSVQYTQDVWGVHQNTHYIRDCPSAHTGRPWLSVCVCLCPSAHTGHPWLSISTHISTLVLGLSTLTLPVDCLGDFGPRGLSVQYTHDDIRGCPSAYKKLPCVFVSTHRTSVAVRVCPCVSISTHMTSVAVRVCPSAHTGRPWLSINTYISTLVLGLSMLALPVDCLGDFGPRGLSVQYTQDIRGCPPAHTGRLWLSVSTHRMSVAVRVCPTLALPVDCSGYFCPLGLSVQYTQDVRGCPSAHTERPCVSVSTHRTSVAVRVCLCVSVSTHKSVVVHQYTYQHVGPWTQHAGPSHGLFG